MTTPRSFRAQVPEGKTDLAPIPFRLEGGPPLSRAEWVEDFTAVPVVPGAVMDDLLQAVQVDARGNRAYNVPSLLAFFRGVLVPEDLPRFNQLVYDTARIVPIEQLGECMVWLSEQLAGRPTTPPSSSGHGLGTGGLTSAAG